jgi:exopolyphosphatase/guanosine-5'-triphosphate,3'-diphosphate pyrophosphatase
LYDGLTKAGVVQHSEPDSREVLQAAAFMHDVGRAKGHQDHQKRSLRMIRKLSRPLGWSARELELAAVVARYHRGALPRPRGKTMQRLDLPDRRIALELAGVLRLANALALRNEAGRNGAAGNATAPKLQVSLRDRVLLVQSAGYSPLDRSAEDVAAARHLLELVLRLPVMVKPLRIASTSNRAANP